MLAAYTVSEKSKHAHAMQAKILAAKGCRRERLPCASSAGLVTLSYRVLTWFEHDPTSRMSFVVSHILDASSSVSRPAGRGAVPVVWLLA